ncbi:M13 family metallopeptidase [Propionibacteriaceae bacterium Y1700]|uniref:M13 family metallopeptidase n=1 Tax=Microlunatus sp. Y1700 TaxID=3418487 RepID=UPI003DA70FF8
MTDSLSSDATTATTVRPQDDLFRHVNGTWLDTAEIPADKPSAGAFEELRDGAEEAVRDIITGLTDTTPGSDRAKIADLYASFIDTDAVEALGATPLAPLLAEVDAVADPAELIKLTGGLTRSGVAGLIGFDAESDPGSPQRQVMFVLQAGLGLPDEEFYREDSYAEIREKYLGHITRSFELAGIADAEAQAEAVVALETDIAAQHWDKVRTRDMRQMYNLMTFDELVESSPGLPWDEFVAGAGIDRTAFAEVVNAQPSFFTGVAALLTRERLTAWQSWLRWRIIGSLSPYLSADFVDERFAFYGTTLNGTPTLKERWKRGVDLVEGALGEAVGQVFVERHFSPTAKARMDELVANLVTAYAESIEALDWMTAETRAKALDKLGKFTPKIGFPVKWRDYTDLVIDRSDLVGNVMRSTAFELDWRMAKLGQPTDPDEWMMTPQTVNAYYHPLRNEIVFPAAILQPPFFSEDADDAENYGGIGAVIGHEIGHGFDDQGSTCDGDGRLVDWWTPEDRAAFEELTGKLITQYSALEPRQTPGHKVNGELTIGENIGDLGGLGIALKAYAISRRDAGQPELTTDELIKVFTSWATVWRYKGRDESVLRRLAIDPHSPAEFRCNQIVRNLDQFHQAFEVTADDAMWLDPSERVKIW